MPFYREQTTVQRRCSTLRFEIVPRGTILGAKRRIFCQAILMEVVWQVGAAFAHN
jgi:hypothetical protein